MVEIKVRLNSFKNPQKVELVKPNYYGKTVWVRIGNRIIKRQKRRHVVGGGDMSAKQSKSARKAARNQVARDNQEVFQGFMLEISAQPFWQRFVFCMRMAFKRHPLQKSMKPQVAVRKRLLRAQKIAAGG